MFCYKCGERLSDSNQKFCQNCGTEIIAQPKTTSFTEKPKIEPARTSQKGPPGKYSKLCFGMALIALALGFIPSSYIIYAFYRIFGTSLNGVMMSLVLNVVGITLAILSRVNSSKAVIHEPFNNLEKIGSTIAVIAIIFNSIGLFTWFLGSMDVIM